MRQEKKRASNRARRREKDGMDEKEGEGEYDGVRYRRRGGLSRKGERETIGVEKGAVREGERKERKREREKSAAKREERRTEASGRLNNIIGGVLTVPGRPRANSTPLSPYGPSPSPYSLLPLSLAASYSPARKLRPRWALREGPTESFESRRWDGETPTERCRTQTRTHEGVRGHLALADRHRGRGSFSPSLRSSPFSFFLLGVSTSKRAPALLPPPLPPARSSFTPLS